MAESPSSALPSGVEWLPALGGAHLLRAEVGRGDPPELILETASGAEHRIAPGPEARFSRSTDFLVPAGLRWSVASLQWPDGTRAVLPLPPEERAEVIALPTRRAESSPAPKPVPLQPLPWTAPPWGDSSDADEAAALWRARRATLEQDLSLAADAVLRARESERATGQAVLAVLSSARADLQAARAAAAADASLLVLLEAELEAERSATEAREASDEITAMRTQLERACHDAAIARAEASSLRKELAAEREARTRAEAALHDRAHNVPGAPTSPLAADPPGLGATTATRSGLRAAADSLAAAADSSPASRDVAAARLVAAVGLGAGPVPRAAAPDLSAAAADLAAAAEALDELGRHAALQGQATERRPQEETGRLVAALDAAASSLRAVNPISSEMELAAARESAPGVAPGLVAAGPEFPRAFASAPVDGSALAPPADGPNLRAAIVALAHHDSVAAGSVLAGLLPVQGAILADDVTYDLTVRGIGTFAVTVENGHAQVQRLPRRRSRREAEFHFAGEPLALARLLAGERGKVRRFGRGARVSGRRRRAKALTALPASRLSLADALRAGARLEPGLVYRALPFVVDPEWTRGHVFTVAQEITELAPRAWYVMARDGVPLHVVEHTAGAAADATVTMTRAAFDRLLRGEPAAEGELPIVRGDHAAVAALKRWTDRAAGPR